MRLQFKVLMITGALITAGLGAAAPAAAAPAATVPHEEPVPVRKVDQSA